MTEPTVLGAAWRYKWFVLGMMVLTTGLGFVFLLLRPPQVLYAANASIVVQASATGLDLGTSVNPQRFVANQIEILRSGAVADLASKLASEGDNPVEISPEDVRNGESIFGSSSSDLIQISFVADDPVKAVVGANSIIAAYKELLSSEKASVTAAALARIDAELVTLDQRAEALSQQISAELASDTIRTALTMQYEDAIAEMVDLQAEARTAEGDRLAEIRSRLGDLRNLINTYKTVQSLGIENDQLVSLQAERDQVLQRKAALLDRRDVISVDVQQTSDIIAFESPAQTAEPSGGSGPGRVLAVALLVGLLGGLGLAYLLASRRGVFHDRVEPQAILGAPLLAEIPEFSEEGLKTRLPVRDSPRSASAESFRFAATSIALKMEAQDVKSVIVLSATLGAGKSTVLANAALAAARKGSRVLLVDADFGNQALTRLLDEDDQWLPRGLTDVVGAGLPLLDAVSTLDLGADAQVFLLTRGRQPVAAAELVQSPKVRDLFEEAKDEFDVVFVDAPPLLQVAYATTLASYVDAAMMVVEHRGSVAQLREAQSRLGLIGVPLLGYVYNRSPLRKEMTFSEGSMADILGDMGMLGSDTEEAKPRPGMRWRP